MSDRCSFDWISSRGSQTSNRSTEYSISLLLYITFIAQDTSRQGVMDEGQCRGIERPKALTDDILDGLAFAWALIYPQIAI